MSIFIYLRVFVFFNDSVNNLVCVSSNDGTESKLETNIQMDLREI
jgi:hypothetical protein